MEFDATQAVKASGLRKGQKVFLKDIEAAAQKLVKTGFFESVGYRHINKRGGLELEFQVEEAKSFLPCTFDNFVWFSHEELMKAVCERIPLFRGTLPQLGTAKQETTEALQNLLRARQIPGTVRLRLNADLSSGKLLGYLFYIADVNLSISSLQFQGVTVISETMLQEKAKSLIGQKYSRNSVMEVVERFLIPLFKEKGYFRVQFAEPAVEMKPNSSWETGIKIILKVAENAAYRWDRAVWIGDLPIPAETLDQIMGMRTGDIADKTKIDEGISAIRRELSRTGSIEARIQETPELNDAAGSVRYRIRLFAGPKYTMGSLNFSGAPGNIEKKLRSKWKIPSGEPFDALYPNEFLNEINAAIDPRRLRIAGFSSTPDHENLVVNVTFEFRQPSKK